VNKAIFITLSIAISTASAKMTITEMKQQLTSGGLAGQNCSVLLSGLSNSSTCESVDLVLDSCVIKITNGTNEQVSAQDALVCK